MKLRLLLGAAALLAAPTIASATVVVTSSTAYDFAAPAGSTQVITFDQGGANYALSGAGSVVTGSATGQYSAPAISATALDGTAFLAAVPGATIATEAVLSGFGTFKNLSLYWGSIDAYNTLDLFNGSTLVGSISGSDASVLPDGNQTAGVTNRRVSITSTTGFDRIGFRTSQNAFEVDNIALSGSVSGAVPEPAAWTMMLAGFALVGCSLRRKRQDLGFAA